jgi:hypothetical protein
MQFDNCQLGSLDSCLTESHVVTFCAYIPDVMTWYMDCRGGFWYSCDMGGDGKGVLSPVYVKG